MKRKTVTRWLAILATLTCAIGTAAITASCKDGNDVNQSSPAAGAIVLVDFKDETLEVGYGKTYNLQLMALDDKGNNHVVQATVTTKSGEKVEVLNGKFIALNKEGYVIKYSFTNDGKTITRTVTLNVVALNKPVIEVDGGVTAVICGKNYQVPTCSAVDYYDGTLDASVDIYKKSENVATDEKMEYDGNGQFQTAEAGEYYVLYTARNSNGITEEKKLVFYVRETAEAGEWDSFDDVGCIYTTKSYNGVKGMEYFQSYAGRDGVLRMTLNGSVGDYTSFWAIAPKSTQLEDYAGYSYIAVSMYVDGNTQDLLNIRLMENCTLRPLKSGEWITYYFDASAWQNEARWNSSIVNPTYKTETDNPVTGKGSVFGDVDIYFDSVYFVNEIPVQNCIFTEDNGVTPAFTADVAPDGYKVTFNGREIPVENGKFQADFVGDYIVQPLYYNSDKISLKTFVYHSVGTDAFALNDYDESITSTAENYTLPTASVVDGNGNPAQGYEVKTRIVYTDTLGEQSTVTTVNPKNKGWYSYTFTAKKEGAKTLEKTVIVRAGDFLEGEILNVKDANVADRFAGKFTGGDFQAITVTAENNATEKLPENLVGKTLVKLAYDTQYTYTTNNSYINFNSVKTAEEVENGVENLVTLSFYLKATPLEEGAEMPTATMKFLGENNALKLNAWNTIQCSYATLLASYNKLATHATWADYAMHITTEIKQFDEFTFYFDNIVMEEKTDLPYAVRVTEENLALIYNKDIANIFVGKDSEKIKDFTGGYEGNAVNMYVDNNEGYRFRNVYKPSQLAKYAKTYDTVTVRLAIDGIMLDGKAYLMATKGSFMGAANGKNYALTKADNGQWISFRISMQEYISLLEENDFEYCFLMKVWIDGSIVEKGSRAQFYIGDIEFSTTGMTPPEEKPEEKPDETPQKPTPPDIVKVNSNTYRSIYLYDGVSKFATHVDKNATEIANFTGDYHGDATKIQVANNTGYRFDNAYTAEELNTLSAQYNTVSLWIAADGFSIAEGEERAGMATAMNTDGSFFAAANGANFTFKTENAKQWMKFSVTMEQYIALVAKNNYEYCQIMKCYPERGAGNTATQAYFYVGDIQFSWTAPELLTIKESTYKDVYMYDGYSYSRKYVEATATELEGFTGDYKGNATKIVIAGNSGYQFKNPYSQEELTKLSTQCSKVSLWIAVDGLTAADEESGTNGNFAMAADKTEGTFFAKAGGFTFKAEHNKQWMKFTISMEDYIEIVAKNNYEYCQFMNCYQEGVKYNTAFFYVGNIVFEL